MQETWIQPWVGKFPWRRKWQPTPAFLPGESHGQKSLVGYSSWDRRTELSFLGFPDSSVGKEYACNAGGLTPRSGRSAEEGIGYPLPYSWAFLVALLVKNKPAMWEAGFHPWVGKILWRREGLPTLVFWPREISINSDTQMTPPLRQKVKRN